MVANRVTNQLTCRANSLRSGGTTVKAAARKLPHARSSAAEFAFLMASCVGAASPAARTTSRCRRCLLPPRVAAGGGGGSGSAAARINACSCGMSILGAVSASR